MKVNPTPRIDDSDMIILESVESRLKHLNIPMNISPEEKIMATTQVRDYLYSDIVARVPRVVRCIMIADLESDDVARGLNIALSKHVMDPVFVNILMQYLAKYNISDDNAVVGAYLCKVINKFIETKTETHVAKVKKKDDKTKTEDTDSVISNDDLDSIQHINDAITKLLGDILAIVESRCCNLTHAQAMSTAACIAMNNKDTLIEILNSDLPITAGVFDILKDPSNIIREALLIEKEEVAKVTDNQKKFLESLKKWVYNKLNSVDCGFCTRFIISVYNTRTPDMNKYYIQLRDCGKQYSNLKTVINSMTNE